MKRVGSLGSPVLVLLPLLLLASPATAQDARAELRDLGPAARLHLPALAGLIDEAEELAREDPAPDSERVYRRRLGRFGPSARDAARDRRALREALEALWLIERAARRRGRPAETIRGLHGQLLTTLRRSYAEAARALEETRSRVPRLDATWESGRSYAELFADAGGGRRVTRYGDTHAATLLLLALAESAREAPADGGPLGDGRFLETLALAGDATAYRLRGRELESGQTYGGRAALAQDAGRLVLTVRRDGAAPLRAPLALHGGGWRLEADVEATAGLAGLGQEAPPALRLEAEYRRTQPGRIEGSWRLLAGEDVVERGRETLTLAPPAGAPADEVEPLLASSPLFARIVAACRPVVDGGTVPAGLLVTTANRVDSKVLLEGPAIFAEQARLIAGAEGEVLFQALTFEPGSEAGQRILGALEELAARRAERPDVPPVRVRIAINSHWGRDFGADGTRDAVEALGLDPAAVDVRVVAHGHTLMGALHSKTLVVDGRRALVTGANPEAVHDAQALPWFDAAFRVDGRAAEGLRAEFDHLWRKVTDDRLPALDLPAEAPPAGRTPVLIATREASGWLLGNSIEDPQGQAFVTAIGSAERAVRIHTPNLNDDAICAAILRAVLEHEVPVRIVVPFRFNETGAKLTGGTNASTVARLQREVRERGGDAAAARLRIRWYGKKDGSGRSVGNEAGASHTKYASFDGQVAIVGSGNLDTQAMNHSREVNLVVDDADVVRAWDAQHFEPSWRRGLPAGPAPVDDPLAGE